MMHGRRWIHVGSFIVAAAVVCAGADARPPRRRPMPPSPPRQHVTVHEARIEIADAACAAALQSAAAIVAIVNDRDRDPYPVDKVNGKFVIRTGAFGFVPEEAHASLHFPNFRTDCVQGEVDDDGAVFRFARCNRDPVSDVTIRMEKLMNVSYVRDLPARQARTVPCQERGWLPTKEIVFVVRFPDEWLDLRLNSSQPDPEALSHLRVHTILELFGKLKKSEFALPPDDLGYVVAVQHAKGHGSTPHLSSVSMDLAIKQMKEYGTLHLTVEPRGSQ